MESLLGLDPFSPLHVDVRHEAIAYVIYLTCYVYITLLCSGRAQCPFATAVG
jgi:hypothetical protein